MFTGLYTFALLSYLKSEKATTARNKRKCVALLILVKNPEGLKAQGPETIEQFTTIENTLENTVNEVKTAVSEDPSIFEEVKGFLNELKEVIDLLKEVKDKLREIGIDLDPISDVLQNFDHSSVESFLGEDFDEQDKEEETED